MPTIVGRPHRDQLLAALTPGDTVVVWQLDRLARGIDDLVTVTTTILTARAHLWSLREGIDTADPTAGDTVRTPAESNDQNLWILGGRTFPDDDLVSPGFLIKSSAPTLAGRYACAHGSAQHSTAQQRRLQRRRQRCRGGSVAAR